jgi:hypothetical protein
MNTFTLQAEECTITPYHNGFDVFIRSKIYYGEQVDNKLYLYRDDDEVGHIDLDTYTLYDMDMNGNPIPQEYYYEGRVYIRRDDQILNKNGEVIAYLEGSMMDWVWLVDYTKEGVSVYA